MVRYITSSVRFCENIMSLVILLTVLLKPTLFHPLWAGEKEKIEAIWGPFLEVGEQYLIVFRVSVSRIAICDALANREACPLLLDSYNQFVPPPSWSVCVRSNGPVVFQSRDTFSAKSAQWAWYCQTSGIHSFHRLAISFGPRSSTMGSAGCSGM